MAPASPTLPPPQPPYQIRVPHGQVTPPLPMDFHVASCLCVKWAGAGAGDSGWDDVGRGNGCLAEGVSVSSKEVIKLVENKDSSAHYSSR